MSIRFQSSVLFVADVDSSRRFYEELLQQKVALDHGENVVFEAGFAIWQRTHARSIIHEMSNTKIPPQTACNHTEFYFECDHLDAVMDGLKRAAVEFVHPLVEQPWGQRVLRVYDPDGFVVEIGEPMQAVILRYYGEGMLAEDITLRTSMPLEIVRQTITKHSD